MALPFGTAGCDDQLARMEANQVKLQAMVAANARQLATVSSQLYVNNGEVQRSIQKLDQNDQAVAAEVTAVQNEQTAVHEAVTSGNQALDKKMATVHENQRLLQDGVTQVATVTQRTASDVTAIAKEHATLHQLVQRGRQETAESLAAVAGSQQTIRTDIGQLQQADQKMAEQLTALAVSQDRIYGGLDGLGKFVQAVASDVAGISRGQAALHQTLNEKAETIVAGMGTMSAEQASLRKTLKANQDAVAAMLAGLSDSHQAIRRGLDDLGGSAARITADLAAVINGQSALRETMKAGSETLAATLTNVSESQTRLHDGLSGIGAKADAMAAGIAAAAERQASLEQQLKAGNEALILQATAAAESQRAVKTGLEGLGGETRQLSAHQQALHDTLDTVTATTGQTALDVIALNDSQARLKQAMHTDRQELAARLADIMQGQQQWVQRLDAAQTNVQTIATSISALEQHLTKLQGSLQTSFDGLTTLLGANGQDRAHFEAKVHQDIQAMIDAVSQLRQNQVSLTEQMQQIQKRAQGQTHDIAAAVQQLDEPTSEIKVSDADTELKSSLPEAASK
jgi:chromosome segregation ATPase